MLRLAIGTGQEGKVTRMVLRGEEGRIECFWKVPGFTDAPVAEPQPRCPRERWTTPLHVAATLGYLIDGMSAPAVQAGARQGPRQFGLGKTNQRKRLTSNAPSCRLY